MPWAARSFGQPRPIRRLSRITADLRLGFRHRCCTNGLGHIHQMERVLGVLQEEGMKFPVIALAREQKVPA